MFRWPVGEESYFRQLPYSLMRIYPSVVALDEHSSVKSSTILDSFTEFLSREFSDRHRQEEYRRGNNAADVFSGIGLNPGPDSDLIQSKTRDTISLYALVRIMRLGWIALDWIPFYGVTLNPD